MSCRTTARPAGADCAGTPAEDGARHEVRIPDYISPIVGWRVWQLDANGLRSLNGEPWVPGRPLQAGCRASSSATFVGRAHAAHLSHDAPQFDCTCGIYGTKNLDRLRTTQYWQYGSVHGEVSFWGSVVEHQQGFRAEFAYPKTLHLSSEMLPVTLRAIQTRIQALGGYGCDLFIAHDNSNIPLWRKVSGLDAAGLEFLMSRSQEWYVERSRERAIKPGDRIAVRGRGIALVEQVIDGHVRAKLWNKRMLSIGYKCIRWDEQNMRWETGPHACVETKAKA